MNGSRMLIKELLKNGSSGKIKFKFNIIEVLEYYKWISYFSICEKEKIDFLLNKDVKNFTSEDLCFLKDIKLQEELSEKFKRYIYDESIREDILLMYDYMRTNSLDKIIKLKLNVQELNMANKIIKDYINLSTEELVDIVNKGYQKENYLSLSMVDAYVIRELNKILKIKFNFQNEKILIWELDRNAAIKMRGFKKVLS